MGELGQNHSAIPASNKQTLNSNAHGMYGLIDFSNVIVQSDCNTKKKLQTNSAIAVGIMDISGNEKITVVKKKYETSVKTNDTILAPDNKAMVLIDATRKIFWLKNIEYNPIAYNGVITIRVSNRPGAKK